MDFSFQGKGIARLMSRDIENGTVISFEDSDKTCVDGIRKAIIKYPKHTIKFANGTSLKEAKPNTPKVGAIVETLCPVPMENRTIRTIANISMNSIKYLGIVVIKFAFSPLYPASVADTETLL